MKFISVTELKNRATQIVSEINSTGEEVIVLKNNKPVVLMHPITENDFVAYGKKITVAQKTNRKIEERMKQLGYDVAGKEKGKEEKKKHGKRHL